MVDDPGPGFRAELVAAIAVLDPQIDGLGDLTHASISREAKALVAEALASRSRRRQLILDVISALDMVLASLELLKADGYPALPNATAQSILFDELQKETAAIATAMKVFDAEPMAAKIVINLGTPTKKVT